MSDALAGRMTAPDPGYRPCVGIALFNAAGLVFVGRRSDTPDAWQMPQGGIDPGESPRAAAVRELREETGVERASLLAESAGWLRYDLPAALRGRVWGGKFRGQAQKWFAFRFLGRESEIRLDAHVREFDAWRWVALAEVPDLIVPFKRAVYVAVAAEFAPLAGPAR